jgi:isopenicillin N synthase-like dioxygenase
VEPDRLAFDLRHSGHTRVQLVGAHMNILQTLRVQASRFFTQPEEDRQVHAGEWDGPGWHRYATRYATYATWPDQNETFAMHGVSWQSIPRHREILSLCTAIAAYETMMTQLVEPILDRLGEYYRQTRPLITAPYSHTEVNWYGTPPKRAWAYLQERHEDGHLLSIAACNRPGLEVELDGRMRPVWPGDGHLSILAGSTLTAMTGGEIKPVYHRVLNCELPARVTVMYFVDLAPEPGRIAPYICNSWNAGMDMATVGREGCTARRGRPARIIWPALQPGERLRLIRPVGVPPAADPVPGLTPPVVDDGEPPAHGDVGDGADVPLPVVPGPDVQHHPLVAGHRRR